MRRRKLLLFIISLIGLITTVKLAMIYYNANFNSYSLSSFCSINAFIDCDGIAQTSDSQFLGIPLAYWGMSFYILTVFLLFVDRLKEVKFLKFLSVFKNPLSYISVLGLFSFLISIILATLSIFQIKKVCILCIFTYFLNLIIFLLSYKEDGKRFIEQVKIIILDFIDGIKTYTITFAIFLLTFICFLTYTSTSYVFAPHVKRIKSIQKFANLKTNPYKVTGNVLGAEEGEITVKLYSDFVCPICYAYNLMIHKCVKELSNIRIEHYNFPLDKECNKYIRIQIHNNACNMAKYGIAAENQNKYWDMATELFEQQPTTDEEAIKIAKKLNMDIKKFKTDIYSERTREKLLSDIDNAKEHGLNGTPAIIINGKNYTGIKPYYELKEIFINAGAK